MRLETAIGRSILLAIALAPIGCDSGGDKAKAAGGDLSAKDQTAALLVKEYAGMAFPLWAREHVDAKCPSGIGELAELTGSKPVDPWGNDLVMLCGENAPAEAKGFGVLSTGADGKQDTADDIKSWDGKNR